MRGLRRQVKKLTEQKEEERETCNAAVQKAMAESCQKMVNALRAQQCSPNTNPNSNSDHKKKYGHVNFFASPQNGNEAGNPASYNHGNAMQPAGSHNVAGNPASYNHGNPMQPVGSHNGAGSPASYNHGNPMQPVGSHNVAGNPASYNHGNLMQPVGSHNEAGSPASYNHGNAMQPAGSHNVAGNPASYNHGNPMQPVGFHNGAGSPASYNHGNPMQPVGSHNEAGSPASYNHGNPMQPVGSHNEAGSPASYNHGNPMQPVGSHNEAGSPTSYNHGNPMQPVGSHNEAGSPTSYNNGAIFAEPAVKATKPWYPPLLIPLFRFFNAELSRHKYAVSESRFKELQQRGYVRESSLGRLIPEADVTTPAIWESCPQLVKLIYVFQAASDDTILVDAAESNKLKRLDYVEMGVLGYCVLAPSKNETVCGANQPITRMYSDTFGEHLFTTSQAEVDKLTKEELYHPESYVCSLWR